MKRRRQEDESESIVEKIQIDDREVISNSTFRNMVEDAVKAE